MDDDDDQDDDDSVVLSESEEEYEEVSVILVNFVCVFLMFVIIFQFCKKIGTHYSMQVFLSKGLYPT